MTGIPKVRARGDADPDYMDFIEGSHASVGTGVSVRDGSALRKRMRELSISLGRYTMEDAEAGVVEFVGDALALLQNVYKDPRVPLDVRIEAAKTAIRFETPALQAMEFGNGKGAGVTVVFLPSDADL